VSTPDFSQHRSSAKQSALEQGKYAEELVAQWLMGQGWKILYRRWRCRWGELDLVATLPDPETRLAFIEVKARSRGNWDADGLLAITPQKQAKLWRTAEAFLAEYPHWAELPCQFDVALVACRKAYVPGTDQSESRTDLVAVPRDRVQLGKVQLGKAVAIAHHRLTLQQYIPNAFG
jgi:putative endonuclease